MENSGEEKIAQELPKSSHITSLTIPSQKEGNVETHCQEIGFASPTPVKSKESSRVKCQVSSVKDLPRNYRVLSEFYDCMTCSLRLLSLRNRAPTFQNVASQVEILTGRKFLLMHLAQIKHILPEAVQIDKILIHDEKTKCMKPDIKIALLFDIIDGHCEESVFLALSSLFSSRLRDFYVAHPEDTEVPEAVLPEPFNQRSIIFHRDRVSKDLSESCDPGSLISSHFSPPVRKSFFQKAAALEMLKTPLPNPKSTSVINEEIKRMTPIDFSSEPSICERTPVKLASGSESLLVETPVQSTPIRPISSNTSVLTCEDENKMTACHNCKEPISTAKKSLDFYCLDSEDSKNSPKEISVSVSYIVQLIQKIFQSNNFYAITKEELIQKIMFHHCEIDDHSIVETQLEHLERLVPDWFYKKLATSGDILYNVKRVSDLNLVCKRISAI